MNKQCIANYVKHESFPYKNLLLRIVQKRSEKNKETITEMRIIQYKQHRTEKNA